MHGLVNKCLTRDMVYLRKQLVHRYPRTTVDVYEESMSCPPVLVKTSSGSQKDQDDKQEVERPVEGRSLQVEREQGALRHERNAQECLQMGPLFIALSCAGFHKQGSRSIFCMLVLKRFCGTGARPKL